MQNPWVWMPILYLLKKIHVQVDVCSNPYYSRVNRSSVWCAQCRDEYQQRVRHWGKVQGTHLCLVWAGDEEDEKIGWWRMGQGLLKVQGRV